jgi:hypothetical protein
LTGEEIVIDLCSLIAAKLRTDCNLRESDSYPNGYSAKIDIHLEVYGMDTVVVPARIVVGVSKENPDPERDRITDATLEIPVEPALNQVRERSEQPVPTMTIDTGGQPMTRPRRYMKQAR